MTYSPFKWRGICISECVPQRSEGGKRPRVEITCRKSEIQSKQLLKRDDFITTLKGFQKFSFLINRVLNFQRGNSVLFFFGREKKQSQNDPCKCEHAGVT